MKKILSIITILLVTGAGCETAKDSTIVAQQEQINNLSKQITELTATISSSVKTQTYQKPAPPTIKVAEDPQIKMELCQTQAKIFADRIARRVYLQASEDAMAKGDEATSVEYMKLSYGPAHPADYDENYGKEYIKCLKE